MTPPLSFTRTPSYDSMVMLGFVGACQRFFLFFFELP